MKLSIDIEFILKRIIVVVLAFVIINCLKSCEVFAAGCSGTWYLGWIDPSTNSWNTATTISRTIPNNTRHIAYALRTSISANQQLTYNSKIGMRLYNYNGNANIVPEVRYAYSGGFVDITGACSYSVTKTNVSAVDDLIRYQYEFTISCYYANTPQTATGIEVHFDLPYPVYTTSSKSSNMYAVNSASCLAIAPSDSQLIINNNNQNSINIENAINEQAQQNHEDLENIENSLNDNSVSNDTNSNASDIFDVNIDTGHGLSSIITAPLSLLQHAQSQCTDKSFTIFGKSITLPCGDKLFWSRDFSSYSSIFNSGLTGNGLNTARDNFRLLWNMLFGGAIMFHLLLKLWEQINLALNPMADSFQSLSSAIDTGSAVRDSDGDVEFNDPINDLRSNSKTMKSIEDDRRFHISKGRSVHS